MSDSNEWAQVNPYAIKRGAWFISKAMVDGATLYTLHDSAGVRYGHWETAKEAKDFAEAMERGSDDCFNPNDSNSK